MESSQPKKVSVVVPCRNEVRYIEKTVDSLLKSRYPNLEIIIVDGMSDDGTRDILQRLQEAHPQKIKIVDNPNQLTPYAFNLGVENAQGDYVQISGARNLLDPYYLSYLAKVLDENPNIGCAGGDYQHTYDSPQGRFISYAMESKFGVGPKNFRTLKKDGVVDTVGIPLYRKEVFSKVGKFDERLTRNQDDDFNFRLTQAGYSIYYCSKAKTTYFVRDSYQKLAKQYMQYGYFKVFVNCKHKTFTTLRQLAPICFLIFLSLGSLLSLISPAFFLLFISILTLYFLLGLLNSKGFTKSWQEMLNIQYAILVMHLSYGYGYLLGVKDFVFLRKSPKNTMQAQTT